MLAAFSEISKWAQKLPYWQQYALSQLIGGTKVDDDLSDTSFAYFLEDACIVEKSLERPVLRFLEQLDFSPASTTPKLKSIGNIQNVNALVTAQTLTVGPHLTTVYGSNGAGKSGYARVLASAGFSRGTREILPDATKESTELAPMVVDITCCNGDTVRYHLGQGVSPLSAYFVFDSESIPAHLTKANALSFSPAGLSCLKDLVTVVENVAQRLDAFVVRQKPGAITVDLTPGDTILRPLVTALSATTDLDALNRQAVFAEADQTRLQTVQNEIARLSQQDVPALLKRNEAMQRDLQLLISELRKLEALCAETTLITANQLIDSHNLNLGAAKAVSLEQFTATGLDVIGSSEWDQFVKAAQKLALQQAQESGSYPSQGDVCLLCHQPLTDDACKLIERTFTYAEGEAQRRVGQSIIAIENLKGKLRANGIAYGAERVSFDYVSEKHPALPSILSEFNRLATDWLTQVSTALTQLARCENKKPLPNPCSDALEEILLQLSSEHTRLKEENVDQLLAELRKEFLLLSHRRDLHAQVARITEFVIQERKCTEMLDKTPKTQGITNKHNQLFNEIVTEKYIELFKRYLDSFVGGAVNVSIKTSGAKGETLRQVVLEGTGKSKLNLTKILSEGEQRAVALADFLTEVTLNDACAGVILDDPVTSFALEWRETAAKILSQLAKDKQVVVFTHDLAFLYWLHKYADAASVESENHWMLRGQADGKPGYVYLNNSPVSEKVYRDATKANEWYKKAKDGQPHDMQVFTQQGFAALRTSYEILVIDTLLKGVVKRFEERVSVESLKDIKWNQPLVEKLMQNYAQLCRCMEGHSHSDALSGGPAQPRDLFDAITKFEEIRKELKNPDKVATPTPLKIVQPEGTLDSLPS